MSQLKFDFPSAKINSGEKIIPSLEEVEDGIPFSQRIEICISIVIMAGDLVHRVPVTEKIT